MSDLQPVGYELWLGDLKAQIQVAQQRGGIGGYSGIAQALLADRQ